MCESLESFSKFYYNFRVITTKLHASKLIAVCDDTFVKEFFSGPIDVEDLQHGAKEFLKEGNKTYVEIIDDLQIDFMLSKVGKS